MPWLPLPYIQLESARTNGADYFDTQWSAGMGYSVQFAGCTFTDGGYLFGAMTSEDSADKFALQFKDGKYIYHLGDQTVESPADYKLGEPHYFSFNVQSWSIDGVYMPTISFSFSQGNPMTLPVYIGAVNVGGEAKHLSDVQIGYIYFNGSSGLKEWRQCKTQDGQYGFGLYSSGSIMEFVEKTDFTYGGVMAVYSGTFLSLVGTPEKKDYKIGEPFDPTGATVYLNLDDGTQRDITEEVRPNSKSREDFNSEKILQNGYIYYLYYIYNPVGVEYSAFQFGGGRQYSVSFPQVFRYTVSADSPVESIEVTKMPDRKEYLIKESFDITGMVVTGHLENGGTAEIGDGYTVSPSYFTKEGTIDVTVSWNDGQTDFQAEPFQVTVKNAVEKLIVTPPRKEEYALGENFNADGITVTALYLDGTETPVLEFSVDSSQFNNKKEGIYRIIVKATIDEKEYTQETYAYVFGKLHNIAELLNTKTGMSVLREDQKNDFQKDEIFGAPWFVFNNISAEKIYVSGDSFISFDNLNRHIQICCSTDCATYSVYSQTGKLDNNYKFLKIRVEGYTSRYNGSPWRLNYELFLFDNNSMFLNILQAPTENMGASQLYYGTGTTKFNVEPGIAQVLSFYTTDAEQGKPWSVEYDYHEFVKEKMRTLTVVNGTGSGAYFIGENVRVSAEDNADYAFLRWSSEGELFSPDANLVKYSYSENAQYLPKKADDLIIRVARSNDVNPQPFYGFTYCGTLVTSGTSGDEEYTDCLHVYFKISAEEDLPGGYPSGEIYAEFENAKNLTIQESTRKENVIVTKENPFLCEKTTEELFLWFVNTYIFYRDERWVAEPDIVEHIPNPEEEGYQYDVILVDKSNPPETFTVYKSREANHPSSILGFSVEKSISGYEKDIVFSMPDKDITIIAEHISVVDRIEITQNPYKMNYYIGENFDSSGMVVTIYRKDGTSDIVEDYTISDFDNSSVGEKTVKIGYEETGSSVFATLLLYVGLSGIAVTKYPYKRAYSIGDSFEKDGLEVSLVYSDNSTEPTENYTLYGFSSESVGIKNITVTANIANQVFNTSFSAFVTKDGENPFSGYNENRTLRIHFVNGEYDDITGDEIESESMSLTESIGNDKNLKFGGCISTQFSVNIFSDQFLNPDTFPDGMIEAYMEADGQSLKIFTGTIESAERTGGISKRKIIAYDFLKRKGTIKLKRWYKSLTFPITQKKFRDSLFEYVGIKQVPVSLEYDNARVPDNMNVDSLTFLSLIKDICFCNMCFGHINADGEFEYIFLKRNGKKKPNIQKEEYIYYAPEDVIPDENVINATFKEGKIWHPKWFWITPDPNYPNAPDREPTDVEAYQGNIYFVRNSYMIGDSDWINRAYGFVGDTQGNGVIYETSKLNYPIVLGPQMSATDDSFLYLSREYTLKTTGDFLRRIGTNIEFNCIKHMEDGSKIVWTINSYIMSRTITGVRGLKDSYSAKNSAYNEEAYGAEKEVRDISDAVESVKSNIPKSTDSNGNEETFLGIETPKTTKVKEQKNKLYVYPGGKMRYNGVTISGTPSGGGGSMGGGFNVQSVSGLPSSPDPNTIYLIQGEVVVE